MSSVRATRSGPLFDGRMEAAIANAANDAEKQVATLGASMVRSRLNVVLRKQTPIYRFKVRSEPEAPGWIIHDQRMVYGPWLEGTGSRNLTTRFKGYRTFRLMTIELNKRAKVIAEGVVARWLGGM